VRGPTEKEVRTLAEEISNGKKLDKTGLVPEGEKGMAERQEDPTANRKYEQGPD